MVSTLSFKLVLKIVPLQNHEDILLCYSLEVLLFYFLNLGM